MSGTNKQTEQQGPDDREQQAQSGPGDMTSRVPALQGEMEHDGHSMTGTVGPNIPSRPLHVTSPRHSDTGMEWKQEHDDMDDGTDDAGSSGRWPKSEGGHVTLVRASRPVEPTATEVAPGSDPAAPDLLKLALERLDSLERELDRFEREGQELQEVEARLVEESASIDSRASRIIQEFEEGGSRASTLNELRGRLLTGLRVIEELREIVDRQEKVSADFRELLRQSRARPARIEELQAELNTARIQLGEAVNRRRDI